jgi:hypothetical protein
MPDGLAALIAFVAEHRRCGELEGGLEGSVVLRNRSCRSRQRQMLSAMERDNRRGYKRAGRQEPKGGVMRVTAVSAVLLLAAVLTLSSPAPPLGLAQGSVGDYGQLSDPERELFVTGYVNGFAVAAQLPSGQAARLQQCFGKWTPARCGPSLRVGSCATRNPKYTARIAMFSALAEACGWKTQ